MMFVILLETLHKEKSTVCLFLRANSWGRNINLNSSDIYCDNCIDILILAVDMEYLGELTHRSTWLCHNMETCNVTGL